MMEKDLKNSQTPPVADALFQGDITIRTLLEALAESVVIIDPTGRIRMINGQAEKLFGYSQEELVGRTLDILLPTRLHPTHREHVEEYFTHPRNRPMGEGRDLVGRRKDGHEIPLEISLSHLEANGHRLAIAFITDITLRKQAEDTLKKRNEELDDFAHTVAHDLKGSLTAIIGHSELLSQSEGTLDAATVRESLDQIHKSSRKMASVIDELLLLASVSKEEIAVKPLEMRIIVAEALARLAREAEEHGAQIEVAEHFPAALGYAPWVEEIWYNYISNALHHGGSPPRIRIGGDAGENGQVEFWVEDQGPGISEEEQATLFTPYARRAKKPRGHGLGLSIALRIAQKLDGSLGVQSRPGAGSRFSFTLPAAES